MWLILILLFVLYYLYKTPNHRQGFNGGPRPISAEAKRKAAEIYKKQKLFGVHESYTSAKKNIPWVDPVIFYDINQMSRDTPLNISVLEKYLNN